MLDQQSDYAILLKAVNEQTTSQLLAESMSPSSPTADVLTEEAVLEKEISLVIEGYGSEATMDALLTLLAQHQITATFFIPAEDAVKNAALLERLQASGHAVGNYGMDAAKAIQPLLEKLNYQASIWSYGSHLDAPRTAYLSGSDLKTLARNSFWELGTSGYRLSYINVFDRYGEFVGELNSDEYVKTYPLLDRRYNHYLMDYIPSFYLWLLGGNESQTLTSLSQ